MHKNPIVKAKTLLTGTIFSLLWLPSLIIAQNITTIAGTGAGGFNGDGNAMTSQLFGPQGLAMDAAGNIYVADLVNHRVRKVDNMTGMITTIAGTGTPGFNGDGILATSAQIANPSALAFDAAGDLYFTDRSNHRIRKITMSTGIISTVAGTGTAGYNGDGMLATAAQLNSPNEVAFDATGNLFIADWINHRVRKVDKITGFISTIAGTGTAGYNGDAIPANTAQINGPCGIIFDNAGNIYIAEYSGHRIRKINIGTGIISTIAGTGVAGYNADGIAATAAQLNFCAYIKFDYQENMYLGDAANQRIRRITASTGIISTVAGIGTPGGYNGDGIPATTAQLNSPYAIYFDRPQCNMYIGDYANNRIRKVTGGFAGCIPLPLNLVFFTGKNNDGYNLLQWQAAGEINNGRFEIERSSDSRAFELIGIMNGAGNSAPSYSYSFTDQYPLNGISYYRLRQTGYDGMFVYSQIIAVANRATGNASITIYPNPGNGKIGVSSSDVIEELRISNLAGQVVYRTIPKEKDISLQLKQAGTYFVQIITADQRITKKITVFR
jgi:sugar lactone lactonase YvrE